MSGDKNYFKYVTTQDKLMGRNKAQQFTILDYLQKSSGVFDENGMLDSKQILEMQARAMTGKKNIWSGFISFNEENSHKIEDIESCIKLVKDNFKHFFKDIKMPRENLDLMCALHRDKPTHLHIHFIFWEKEPKIKNPRAKGYVYRAKGKLPQKDIETMIERLNYYQMTDDFINLRKQVVFKMKEYETYKALANNESVKYQVQRLMKLLPHEKKLYYGHKAVEPHHERLELLVNDLIKLNPKLQDANRNFRKELADKKKELSVIMDVYYKDKKDKELKFAKENPDIASEQEPFQVKTIERLEKDYTRRLCNVVLRQIYFLQKYEFHYDKTKKYKVNDKHLKRGTAISSRKINSGIDKLIDSVVDLFTPHTKSHHNRLGEIEEEMKLEHEEQNKKAQQEQSQPEQIEQKPIRSKYDWGK